MCIISLVTSSLEEHIVQACLLDNLVPSYSFQLAVSQVNIYTLYMSMIQCD